MLTSPEKEMFNGITKQDLADYYAKVADLILPHIKGRVLSLVRCPKGSSEPCFYAKNPQDNSQYYIVNDKEGLLYEVQMNTIEFHTWGSKYKELDKPDVMVFDLDPSEGLGLAKVRQGVRDLKSILDELGLESFLKTSGGKGYHIVVRYRSDDWENFKKFAKQVAELMEAKWPNRYTTNIRKDARVGKIFVDYLRNAKGATSIAPYSVRAKPGAPISMPIDWEKLDMVKPNSVTIKNIDRFIKNT